jgi:thymidylate kinase
MRWRVIDASRPVADVVAQVRAVLNAWLDATP